MEEDWHSLLQPWVRLFIQVIASLHIHLHLSAHAGRGAEAEPPAAALGKWCHGRNSLLFAKHPKTQLLAACRERGRSGTSSGGLGGGGGAGETELQLQRRRLRTRIKVLRRQLDDVSLPCLCPIFPQMPGMALPPSHHLFTKHRPWCCTLGFAGKETVGTVTSVSVARLISIVTSGQEDTGNAACWQEESGQACVQPCGIHQCWQVIPAVRPLRLIYRG